MLRPQILELEESGLLLDARLYLFDPVAAQVHVPREGHLESLEVLTDFADVGDVVSDEPFRLENRLQVRERGVFLVFSFVKPEKNKKARDREINITWLRNTW